MAAGEQLLVTLAASYPRLHALEVTVTGGHGLLIRWPGRSSERPVVLTARLGVLPTPDTWRSPSVAAAICEAVEALLADGFTPAQDVWLSLGCDEEAGGAAARAAVAELQHRGVWPWFVLDAGGTIAEEGFVGVAAPLAVIGVAEKGTTILELRTTGDGAHASVPVRNGPAVRLARALTRVDEITMPGRLPEPTLELLRRLKPHLPTPLRPVANPVGRATPLVTRMLPFAGPETAAAMTRTTFAITTLEASPASDATATATAAARIDVRVMVGDTVADVVAAVRGAMRDYGVEITVVEAGEASPISPMDDAFELIESCVGELFPEAIPTPYVMLTATDSRFFTAICERVYRFTPLWMSKAQRRMPAADERLGLEDYRRGISWYRRLLESLPA